MSVYINVGTNRASYHFLYLSGQPFNEPIYGKGYFVMNNYSEILQAYEDLKNGQFLNPQSSK